MHPNGLTILSDIGFAIAVLVAPLLRKTNNECHGLAPAGIFGTGGSYDLGTPDIKKILYKVYEKRIYKIVATTCLVCSAWRNSVR